MRKPLKKTPLLIILFIFPATLALGAGDTGSPLNMTHQMMMLVIQLGIIIFAARLGNILFEQLRLPGVLGELFAGLVVGPFVLGGVRLPGFPAGLFPVYSSAFPISPELYGICTLASIVLLFMVGLETDFTLFIRYSFAGSMVAVGGVVLSFVVGDLLGMLFSPLLFGLPLGFFAPPNLFLGILSTATSVGITARILAERGKLDSPEGVTILSGAVIDDVLGIILLAVGLGIISTARQSGDSNWLHIGSIAAKAIGIWLTATVLGLLASRKISLLLKWFGDRSSIAMMALGFALVLAGLFEEAGLAMIIGSYIMGLSLSKTDINQVIMEKLTPIYALFVPVFFAVMGMLVNLRLLFSRNVLLFGTVYTLAAIAAKVIGCGVPSLFVNFNLRGALRIGFGMLPRGEVALIIAGIGLAAGLLSPEIFGVGVMMTLVTTLIAPPVLIRLFSHPGRGIRHIRESDEGRDIVFPFPSVQTTLLISNKLLYLFDTEGFFVHTLNQIDHIYQLRKDDIVIDIQVKGKEIHFKCRQRDVPYINTAMYEVLAEFEAMIKELRQPIDGVAIGRKLQEKAVDFTHPPNYLSNYITREVLRPSLKSTTKEEVIEELLDILNQQGVIKNYPKALGAVMGRERSMSTGIQYGIAIPHGRTDAVDHLVCAIGLKPEGINFDSIDGEPTKIIVLTLSPESASAPHMQFMSMISQALDAKGRDALLACKNARQMYEALVRDEEQFRTRGFRFLKK